MMKFDISNYCHAVINIRTKDHAELFDRYMVDKGIALKGRNPITVCEAWKAYGPHLCVNWSAGTVGSKRYYTAKHFRILRSSDFDWEDYEIAYESDRLDQFLSLFSVMT